METTTSEVLNRAADLIEKHGWITGDWGLVSETGAPAGPMCLEGAIIAALPMKERLRNGYVDFAVYDDCAAGQAVERYLDDQGGGGYAWNDADGRTAEEVVAVLRAAALIEAAREEQDAAWATYAELVTA